MNCELKYAARIQWILVLVFAAIVLSRSEKNYHSVNKLSRSAELTLPSGRQLKIDLALTISEQGRGVSGIKDKDYAGDRGMLFVYWDYAQRQFWMPETYFDLDIFFFGQRSKNFKGRTQCSPLSRPAKTFEDSQNKNGSECTCSGDKIRLTFSKRSEARPKIAVVGGVAFKDL